MKAFKLTALALGGGMLIVMGISVATDMLFGKQIGMFITMPVALLIGLNARRGAEALLGYTLLEALKEDQNDADGN